MNAEATNYLGRCKECDYALFATPESIIQADNAKAGGPAVNVGNGQIMGRCTKGHKWFMLRRVEGTFNKDHKCDSRCLNAKGHDCTCACGGANHGRGYAVAEVVEHKAAAEFIERVVTNARNGEVEAIKPDEPKHIGEVGRTIRGTATVTQEADGNRPYQFTTKSGAVIVWFVPDFIEDPEYRLGDEVTFRAKVKAHTEFRGVGQTVVTYFEQQEDQS